MPVTSELILGRVQFFSQICAINYNTKVINFESKKVDIAQHSAIRLLGVISGGNGQGTRHMLVSSCSKSR